MLPKCGSVQEQSIFLGGRGVGERGAHTPNSIRAPLKNNLVHPRPVEAYEASVRNSQYADRSPVSHQSKQKRVGEEGAAGKNRGENLLHSCYNVIQQYTHTHALSLSLSLSLSLDYSLSLSPSLSLSYRVLFPCIFVICPEALLCRSSDRNRIRWSALNSLNLVLHFRVQVTEEL